MRIPLSLTVALAMVGAPGLPSASMAQPIAIPEQSDWVDYGTILAGGELGDWDFQLFGAFSASAVEKNGTTYLYYNGTCCYRIIDDSVTWRSIGVATSPDGINFTKHVGNPIITWFPNNSGEEGSVSTAAVLDTNGEIVLYYGANTEESPTTVNADGRLAVSSNGLDFTDQGIVLDHDDSSVWGSGDELFPIAAIRDDGQWIVYYLPNGTPQSSKLGVAWGMSRGSLDTTDAARDGGNTIPAWGTGGTAKIDTGTWALFINDVRAQPPRIEVRTLSPAAPGQLSAPVETYQFPDVRMATVRLDAAAATWFMYYRNADSSAYGVKLAPVGSPDVTPPSAPNVVTGTAHSHEEIELNWTPATDSETGIVQYKVFRDGAQVAVVKGLTYTDNGLEEAITYSYKVSAINYHGTEGPQSGAEMVTTHDDTRSPVLESVTGSGNPQRVVVVFDEPVEESSAEDASNYSIDPVVAVTAASLGADSRTVTLTTSSQAERQDHALEVSGVRDRSQNANTATLLELDYTFTSAEGLIGCWRLDDGSGTVARDTSNFGQLGSLVYPGKSPATWVSGLIGGALDFDGVDDLVTIPGSGALAEVTGGSHTMVAWVMPHDLPPNNADNNTYYSVLTRQGTGLFYSHTGKFRAVVEESDGDRKALESAALAPGVWHHVAMVADTAAAKLRLYVDGLEVGASPKTFSGSLADFAPHDYYIGTGDPLVERWDYRMRGVIDEVFLFDRALSAGEIAALAVDPGPLEILADGFESGDTSAWSISTP
jgi:hypothetical protein